MWAKVDEVWSRANPPFNLTPAALGPALLARLAQVNGESFAELDPLRERERINGESASTAS